MLCHRRISTGNPDCTADTAMKLKNVCPYRVGQKVYHPVWEHEYNARPVLKIEVCGGSRLWKVWVPDSEGNPVYWFTEDVEGRRLTVVE